MRRVDYILKAALQKMRCPRSLVQAQGMAKSPQRLPQTRRKEVITVAVSIPLWSIVGAVVYIAWRYMGLRAWQLLACVVLGVLLAATSAGPEINNTLNGFVHWLSKP
jgi:hypothetical protein